MSNVVLFDQAEIAAPGDFTRIGTYARAGLDAVVGGAIAWPAHWARITVSQKAGFADVVTVSPGDYHDGDLVFSSANPVDLNLQVYKPIAASDEIWVALILRGSEQTLEETRSFETGDEPLTASVPVQALTPKVSARIMSVVVQQGTPQPSPALRPVIAEDDCCIAFVRLKTTGIQEIVANEPGRVKTVFEIEGRLSTAEQLLVRVIEDTTTIATNLANLGEDVAELRGAIPRPELIRQFSRDISRHNQILNVPDEARNYWFDQALVKDFWDTAHVDARFRIDEGIQFQYVNQRDAQLRLGIPYSDASIKVWDSRVVLPAYDEAVRIQTDVGAARKDISNTVHTVITAVQKQKKHTKTSYGPTVNVCENAAGWAAANLAARRPQETFANNGQTFQLVGFVQDNGNGVDGHKVYAVKTVKKQTYYTTYTEYLTEEFGLTGAIYGQTFLCSQIMVATSIDLYFTRVGSTGDVLLCICELNESGSPDFDAVIARVNKPRAELLVNEWNRFAFEPTLLEQGKRYAFFTVTTGNHQVAMTANYVGGSSFVSTDGIWSQGSITEDFAFRLNAARFRSVRTIIPFEALVLDGGMTEIVLTYQNWEPASTALVWEIKPDGADEWTAFEPVDNGPLTNLPPLVQLRLVMIGTPDVAPSINIDTNARAVTGRRRGDLQAISKPVTLGFSTTQAQIVVNMDDYDPAHHTVSPKLIVDTTVVTPASVTSEQDRLKPTRRKFIANFTLGAAATTLRLRLDATTDTPVAVPFGQDIQLNAF